jgi:hypothetical protein
MMQLIMELNMRNYKGVEYNDRHGGPFDRGSADSWYSRGIDPHYYVGDTHTTTRIDLVDMSKKEIEDYIAGYNYNEELGGKKEYD